MLVFFGYAIVVASIFGGYAAAGGHLGAMYQPLELVMIGGAAIGAFIVGNPAKTLKATAKVLPTLLKGSKYTKALYMELMSLLYELLDCPYRTEPVEYRAGQVVRDTTIILVAGDADATRQVMEASRVAATGQEHVRAVRVVGPRGHHYLIIANFADAEQTARLRPPGEPLAPLLELRLGPLETQVIGE